MFLGREVSDPLWEKFRSSAAKKFMTIPIHIFCAYFMEIGRWEVNEAMCCFGDKNAFFASILL